MMQTNPFGQQLRQLRKDRDMTLRDVAEASGLSLSLISRLESGERPRPRKATLSKLEKALKLEDGQLGDVVAQGRKDPFANVLRRTLDEIRRMVDSFVPVYPCYPKQGLPLPYQIGLAPHFEVRLDRVAAWEYTGSTSCYAKAGDVLVYDLEASLSTGDLVVFYCRKDSGVGRFDGHSIDTGLRTIASSEVSNAAVVLCRLEFLHQALRVGA